MATTAVYGDRVKIADAQALQQSTPPGFMQNWKYGKNSNGDTIFEYINPNAPKMTWEYNSKNQLVEVPDIGWDGKPWTNKTWLNTIYGFAISPDGRSMVSTVPAGQTSTTGVDSSQSYTIRGTGLNTTVNFSYGNQWGSGGSSAALLNIADVAPEKQGEYLSSLTKYATGEYLPVKQYVTKTGDPFSDFLASIDPSTAISRELTNLYQPVEKTVSKELAQLDKDLSLSQNAPALAAIALSVAAPGVGSAIGQQMIAAGLLPAATSAAVASAIGTGVANAALQVAQGKSADDALKSAVVGGVAGFAGGQVGDYLVGDPGAVKNFVSSTAANMVAGKDPETAAKTALVQTGIQGTANAISTAQAAKYIENLPIPDYLAEGTAATSADTMAAFPETNPANFVGPPAEIDTTLKELSTAAPTTQTYTFDDGSTITVDASGTPISFTEATDTPYKGEVKTPSSPLTQSQVEGLIKLGLGIYGTSQVANVVRDAISSGDEQTQTGFPFTPSDISDWARPEYTKTWQAPIDINSLFTTDNLLGGTQWAGLQGNQFANIPQVSMSDFISSIQNGKI